MAQPTSGTRQALKDRALAELKVYWIITLYLWLFLGLFTVYRRLVVAESGNAYLHYGIALVEALVIAKVVLIGRLFGFSRRFEDHALVLPVIYKSVLFGVLVMLFGLLEHTVSGWVHGKGLLGGLHELKTIGMNEVAARALTLIVAFIPFFAFWELGRVLGVDRLASIFFKKPRRPLDQTTP
ncbi:hypothetical protein [Variovorax sp. J31P207]|uniref:hypothetical protein n=1 Tax=Variovorax sp. J31P207 TaxID=3053510 RepID=UPI0025784E33|nr:hypothetical protein [Variovorax sp. J31P207]MDM0072473.1 hypothetical protein [Variovorax sp. J31P207]